MRTCCFLLFSLAALLLNNCNNISGCSHKLDNVIELSDFKAAFRVGVAPDCNNATFTLQGSVTPRVYDPAGVPVEGEPSPLDIALTLKREDCTVVAPSGKGADKVLAKKEASGYCLVTVPFGWVADGKSRARDVSLTAGVVAAGTGPRCKYEGPTPGTNVGFEFVENVGCKSL